MFYKNGKKRIKNVKKFKHTRIINHAKMILIKYTAYKNCCIIIFLFFQSKTLSPLLNGGL